MKHRKPLLVTTLSLLLFSCGGSSQCPVTSIPESTVSSTAEETAESAKTSSTTSESSTSIPTDVYEEKDIEVKYVDPSKDTYTTIRFYEGYGEIPYIGLSDYYYLILVGTKGEPYSELTITHDESRYLVSTPLGGEAEFDVERQTFLSADFFSFNNLAFSIRDKMENVPGDNLPFTRFDHVTSLDVPKAKYIDFSSYDIAFFAEGDEVYLPIPTLDNMFAGMNMLYGMWNRESLYVVHEGLGESLNKKEAFEGIWRTVPGEEYREFLFNEWCLHYDQFVGHPDRSAMDQCIDLTRGVKKGLEQSAYGRLAKKYYTSDKLHEYMVGVQMLGWLISDGGHAVYQPGYFAYTGESGRTVYPSFITQKVIADYNALIAEVVQAGYGEYGHISRSSGARNYVQQARKDAFSLRVATPYGEEGYVKRGDTAFIITNDFMSEFYSLNKWQDYYEGKSDKIPYGEREGGTVTALYYGLQKAEKDDEIKNIVIDISANGGGSTDEMLYMFAILTGDPVLHIYNQQSGQREKLFYEVDTNLDGEFDEEDLAFRPGKDKNIAVLTTSAGFSCAGISPVFLHDHGYYTIGEPCGGGSCAVYMSHDAYGLPLRTSSPFQLCTSTYQHIDSARFNMLDEALPFETVVDENGSHLDYGPLFDAENISSLIKKHYA